jgi:aminopeptidase YwaD
MNYPLLQTIKIMRRGIFAACLLISFSTFGQIDSKSRLKNLKTHISTLASDEFGGREPGTKGEVLAYNYIIKQYKEIGLLPKGTDGYLQPFSFTKRMLMDSTSSLVVDGKVFKLGADFFPLGYTSNSSVNGGVVNVGYGISIPKLEYNDYKDLKGLQNKIFIIELSTPDKAGPHSKYIDGADIRTKIDTAISKGAAAVIFVNSDTEFKNPEQEYSNRINPSTIPVLFATGAAKEALLKAGAKAEIKSGLIKEEATGHNVIGFIDNGSAYTIVIGAHYDHLGMGGHESLFRGDPQVHNGADDNASGIAALIEIARALKSGGNKSNNYLIMAYSGEEKGLLGSGYFVKHPTLALDKMNYMINMDMVGRLKREDPTLLINGAGTSDAWKIAFNYIKIDSLKIKTTESGIGPSDHTSFYLKDIPVLHFFSGTHSDYHKPSDDEVLINYEGEERIIDFILQLISKLDDKGKLTFIKTKDESNDDAPRFKVTLGVVPDYGFEGQGMRIDGITEGKPASKAGLKAGDIVIQIGDHKVVDMMSYMKALGKFTKGEKAMILIKRGTEEKSIEVEF